MQRLAQALALALGASAAHADTVVSNCADDASAGTLRSVLAAASNGDVIDVSACSIITLTQGELPIAASVTLHGPSSGTTTLDAAGTGRVLHSTSVASGNDNLTISHLTIQGGRSYAAASAPGGCILSGNLTVQDSVVRDCIVGAAGASTGGGAVRADKVYLLTSRVEDSAAYAAGSGAFAVGGGVAADSLFHCVNSTISGNRALSSQAGEGGGVEVNAGSLYMRGCTVSDNIAQYTAGVLQFGATPSDTAFIVNSTVSGNHATVEDGAIFTGSPLTLSSSTVAFNSATYYCGGVRSYQEIVMMSSIIANNSAPSANCVDFFTTMPAGGTDNLISVMASNMPVGTIIADPKLTPLADHGGPTATHGLSLSSPAVDTGNAPTGIFTDQRDVGFSRVGGGAADIGAYERQFGDDEIFYGGFR